MMTLERSVNDFNQLKRSNAERSAGSFWHRDCLYRHEKNTTVAFEVVKQFFIKEKNVWSLKVCWYNIGRGKTAWPMSISQRLEIPHAKKKEWHRMEFDTRWIGARHVDL